MADSWWVRAFGRFRWTPPAWLARLGARGAAVVLLGVAGLAFAAWGIGRYLDTRPQPPALIASVAVPALSSYDDTSLTVAPLDIHFSVAVDASRTPITSVAALDQLDAVLHTGVALSPALAGEWRWHDENTLRFQPGDDWPADQPYRVRLDKSLFAPNLHLAERELRFTTAPFTARLDSLEFYQHPENTSERKVIASLAFSHPVTAEQLAAHAVMGMRAAGATVADAAEPVSLSVRLGPQGRRAYLHSEVLTLPEAETYLGFTLAGALPAAAGTATLGEPLQDRVRIPDRSSYFRVQAIDCAAGAQRPGRSGADADPQLYRCRVSGRAQRAPGAVPAARAPGDRRSA